jgi:putative glycosyltransferase (TIGR04372 family)
MNLLAKISTASRWVAGVAMAVPVLLLVRLVRPVLLVRFGALRSDVIGHMIYDPAYYLVCQEIKPLKVVDCFYFTKRIHPNKFVARLIRRNLRVSEIFRYCEWLNRKIPGGESHCVRLGGTSLGDDVDPSGVFQKTTSVMSFSSQERANGLNFLKAMGFSKSDQFICLVNRDPAYKRQHQSHVKKDWGYHSFRNSSIESYSAGIEALVERGYWVFRMGKSAEDAVGVEHPRVIDYPFLESRSDFLDVWLMANAFFTISSGTGLDTVSTVYRRPVVYLDYIPIKYIVSYNRAITLPKKLFWEGSGRMLSMDESLKFSFQRSRDYEDNGIGINECSQEEKRDAILEMEERLNNNWMGTVKDDILQKQFWAHLKSWPDCEAHHGVIHPEARLVSSFLRQRGAEYLNIDGGRGAEDNDSSLDRSRRG